MLQSWVLYALGSGLSFACMALAYKKVFTFWVSPILLSLFAFGFAFLVFLGVNLVKTGNLIPPSKAILFILLGATFLLLGNFFYINAVSLAPNPWYATAIKTTEILFATFLAFFIFHSRLSLTNILGILLIFAGAFLVAKK